MSLESSQKRHSVCEHIQLCETWSLAPDGDGFYAGHKTETKDAPSSIGRPRRVVAGMDCGVRTCCASKATPDPGVRLLLLEYSLVDRGPIISVLLNRCSQNHNLFGVKLRPVPTYVSFLFSNLFAYAAAHYITAQVVRSEDIRVSMLVCAEFLIEGCPGGQGVKAEIFENEAVSLGTSWTFLGSNTFLQIFLPADVGYKSLPEGAEGKKAVQI